MYCAREPASLKKIRDEFMAYAKNHPASEDSSKNEREAMYEIMDLEATQDLEYLNHSM